MLDFPVWLCSTIDAGSCLAGSTFLVVDMLYLPFCSNGLLFSTTGIVRSVVFFRGSESSQTLVSRKCLDYSETDEIRLQIRVDSTHLTLRRERFWCALSMLCLWLFLSWWAKT